MTRIVLFALLLGIAISTGCSDADLGSAANKDNVGKTDYQSACTPVDFKNGVIFFPCVRDEFGNALSSYLGKYADRFEVVTMASDAYESGMWVTFRAKVQQNRTGLWVPPP